MRLKAYTDEIHKKQIYDKNLLTGIVNGESSVVYTYLYLFKLTGKRVWMIYAEKHCRRLLRGYGKKISQLDYLSGNAGAIVVAEVMLYKETGNLKYYEIAADMAKDLWKKGQGNRKWIRMEIKRNRRTAGWNVSWQQWISDGLCSVV